MGGGVGGAGQWGGGGTEGERWGGRGRERGAESGEPKERLEAAEVCPGAPGRMPRRGMAPGGGSRWPGLEPGLS